MWLGNLNASQPPHAPLLSKFERSTYIFYHREQRIFLFFGNFSPVNPPQTLPAGCSFPYQDCIMATPYSWSSLPHEVQEAIFQLVICENLPRKASRRRKLGLARLASVCGEWQIRFERHIFRRLVISDEDLYTLAKMVKGPGIIRLTYMQYLWLRVKLATYDCRDCGRPENTHTITTSVPNLIEYARI